MSREHKGDLLISLMVRKGDFLLRMKGVEWPVMVLNGCI